MRRRSRKSKSTRKGRPNQQAKRRDAVVLGAEHRLAGVRARLGQQIARLRVEHGWSQARLATALARVCRRKVNVHTIGDWERGKVTLRALDEVARVFGEPLSINIGVSGEVDQASAVGRTSDSVGKADDTAFALEKAVLDGLKARGFSTEAGALALPEAQELLRGVADVLVDGVEARLHEAHSTSGGRKDLRSLLRQVERDIQRQLRIIDRAEDRVNADREKDAYRIRLYRVLDAREYLSRLEKLTDGFPDGWMFQSSKVEPIPPLPIEWEKMSELDREGFLADAIRQLPANAAVRVVRRVLDGLTNDQATALQSLSTTVEQREAARKAVTRRRRRGSEAPRSAAQLRFE